MHCKKRNLYSRKMNLLIFRWPDLDLTDYARSVKIFLKFFLLKFQVIEVFYELKINRKIVT